MLLVYSWAWVIITAVLKDNTFLRYEGGGLEFHNFDSGSILGQLYVLTALCESLLTYFCDFAAYALRH
jgi:hypothetical protein